MERSLPLIMKCIRLERLCMLAALAIGGSLVWAQESPKAEAPKPDAATATAGKPADMSKPVKVFILLGQSNMVGMGKITGGEGSLENAVKEKKYLYLVDEAGNWIERKDVRFVRYMQGKGMLNNEWMTVKSRTIGPEFGIGHVVGNAIDAPVMILKSCIGNGGMVLEGHLAVDGKSGKYPEFKGNVATVYSNPMAQGGSGNGHYGGKAEVYMDVMGRAMVELLESSPATSPQNAEKLRPDGLRAKPAAGSE
jgi:hypothetical protein